MAGESFWEVMSLRIYAVIYIREEEELPYTPKALSVIGVQAHYAMNTIPSCDLRVQIGRNARTLQPSEVHSFINDLRLLTPIKVFLEVTPRYTSAAHFVGEWPDRPFVLFEGYAVGVAADSSFGGQGVTIRCTGWPADLAFSSAVSRDSAPTNPASFSFGAAYRLPPGAGVATSPVFYSSHLPVGVFQDVDVMNDLWGRAIAKWYRSLCSQNRFASGGPLPNVPQTSANYEALRALARFEGFDEVPYTYGEPLTFDSAALDAPLAAKAISIALQSTSPDSIATTTLWDKLLDYSAQYSFALCPMAERMLVAPFTPGLREVWTTIRPNEYEAFGSDAVLSRPLRGVGIIADGRSVAGAFSSRTGQSGYVATVGAFYESDDPGMRRGMTHFRGAPPWMNLLLSPALVAASSAGHGGLRAGAAAPGVGEPVAAAVKPAGQAGAANAILGRYARQLYLLEKLRGRQVLLRGRLRVDIAPGSTIRVYANQDGFITEKGIQAPVVVGHVDRVSVIIDAEARQAFTLFGLSHFRSEAENEDDDTSTETHPLYSTTVPGAPLCEFSA
jgi:hypothetical protein